MYNPDYEMTDKQKKFVASAKRQKLKIEYNYSGRCMYGRCCPSVIVKNVSDFTGHKKYSCDNMGLWYVIYCP